MTKEEAIRVIEDEIGEHEYNLYNHPHKRLNVIEEHIYKIRVEALKVAKASLEREVRNEWIEPKSTEWQGKYSTDEEAYKTFAKDYLKRRNKT